MTSPALIEAHTPGPYEIYAHPVSTPEQAKAELAYQVDHTAPMGDHLYMVTAGEKCVAVTGCGPSSEANAQMIASMFEQVARLTDERDEALAGPWPKWASDLLDILREYTGPCPEDSWEGVDLPEEMRVWLEGYREEMERTAKALGQ